MFGAALQVVLQSVVLQSLYLLFVFYSPLSFQYTHAAGLVNLS